MKRSISVPAVLTTALLTLGLVSSAWSKDAHVQTPTVHIRGGEFYFKMSKRAVPYGRVVFVFTNVGQVAHDFQINGKKTPSIAPHRSFRLTVTLPKPGKYHYSCTVPGHAQAGMKGVLTVR